MMPTSAPVTVVVDFPRPLTSEWLALLDTMLTDAIQRGASVTLTSRRASVRLAVTYGVPQHG